MHSYAQTNDFQCPVCGQPFRAEIWLIVDAGERPDLVDRARAGDLHAVACPACGPLGTVDAPLLLYFPDYDPATGQPPLIFSPPQQSSTEQDQELAGSLLGELARRLGNAWQDEWLAQVLTAPRALLPAALSEDPDAALRAAGESESEGEGDLPPAIAAALMEIAATLAAEGVIIDSPDALERALAERPDLQARLEAAFRQVADDVMTADDLPGSFGASGKVDDDPGSPPGDPDPAGLPAILNRFLAAETWDESQRIVESHPELLSDEADERFALALAEYAVNPDAVQFFTVHRDLLRRCRDESISRSNAKQIFPFWRGQGLAKPKLLGLSPKEFLMCLGSSRRGAI